MKKVDGATKVLSYICVLCVFVFGMIAIVGSGGGGGGSGGGTAPIIDNAVLTDGNFNPKSEFNIGDTANVLVTATDPEKNMEVGIVEQYYLNYSTDIPYCY